MNKLIHDELERIARKVWQYRELHETEGTENGDWETANKIFDLLDNVSTGNIIEYLNTKWG